MQFIYSGNKKQLKTLIQNLVEGTNEYKNVQLITEPIRYDYIYSVMSHGGKNEVVQDLSTVLIEDEPREMIEHISITIGKAEYELLGLESGKGLHYFVVPGKGVY